MTLDPLMHVKWTGDRERDAALEEMIEACVAGILTCRRLAESCRRENDERLTMTADFLQECAEVCRGAVEVLSGGDSQDTATLRDAVTKCSFEAEQASYESRRYLPEEYPRFSPKPSAAGLSPAIMRDLRLCTDVLIRCWESCEDLFRVWFDEELWETYSIDSHTS